MKYLTLSLFFFCINTAARAQKDSVYQAFLKKRYGYTYIQLPEKHKSYDVPSIFNDIRVIDSRRDTSRLGLSTFGFSRGQIRFRTSAADAIAAYLHQHFTTPEGNRSLLVVIKDLWLFDDRDSIITESFKRTVRTKPQGNIVFRCEAYLRIEEGYVPLTYLDTLVSSTAYNAAVMGETKLPQLLFRFMNKVADLDLDALPKKRRVVSYNAIDSFSRTRFNYAMDTATRLQKGIYASLEEFLNNQPSTIDYKIEKDREPGLELHIRGEDGKYYYTHTIWGFCDGQLCYAMLNGSLFPILPIQHQFYVYGAKGYKPVKVVFPYIIPSGGGTLYGINSIDLGVEKDLTLFRLDVRSGEFVR